MISTVGGGRSVGFNAAEGWSLDVNVDIADELRRRFADYE
jgi:hypothetical protein